MPNENQPWYARLTALIDQGLTTTQAVDYMAVEDEGIPPAAWSGMRGTETDRAAAVSVEKAKQILAGDDDQPADQ